MSDLVKWTLIFVGSAVGLYILDRLLLKAEANGYIFYRKKKANGPSVGSALMQIHGFLEPAKRYVVEARQQVVQQNDDAGGPPKTPEGEGRFVVQPMPEKDSTVVPLKPRSKQ